MVRPPPPSWSWVWPSSLCVSPLLTSFFLLLPCVIETRKKKKAWGDKLQRPAVHTGSPRRFRGRGTLSSRYRARLPLRLLYQAWPGRRQQHGSDRWACPCTQFADANHGDADTLLSRLPCAPMSGRRGRPPPAVDRRARRHTPLCLRTCLAAPATVASPVRQREGQGLSGG